MTLPLVSIVTPVYNGEEYLVECIESVLAQTYRNWDLTIVNNCSTDRTLQIARDYAARHGSRIRVHDNERFLDLLPNHNAALRQISSTSKYCKPLFADDVLFPDCLSEMVDLAEAHQAIGLVCTFGTDGRRVLWDGLPYTTTVVPGLEFCRWSLLGIAYVTGTPTSQMFRSDLVRKRQEFYDPRNVHADYEACLDVLQESDLGFVQQVLCLSRRRAGSADSRSTDLYSHVLGCLTVLLKYGPRCLTPAEYAEQLERMWRDYYRGLGENALRLRSRDFWRYHAERLNALGCSLDRSRLAAAILVSAFDLAIHPKEAAAALARRCGSLGARTKASLGHLRGTVQRPACRAHPGTDRDGPHVTSQPVAQPVGEPRR